MKPAVRRVVNDVLVEGTDDFVSLHHLVWYSRVAAEEQQLDHRELVSDAARALLEGGLAKIGNLGDRIIQWPGTPEQVTSRLVSQCVAFDWQPMGDGCWIENTPAGDAWAEHQTEQP